MSIGNKIIFAVILAFTLLYFVANHLLIHREQQRSITSLHQTIERTNQLLKQVNTIPLYEGDKERLQYNLNSFFMTPEIYALSIKEFRGDIALNHQRPEPDRQKLLPYTLPLTYQGNQIGTLQVVYRTAPIYQRLQRFRNEMAVGTLLLLLLTLLLVSIITRKFVTPIKQLTGLTEKIARGDLDTAIEIKSRDEVATLGHHFIKMQNAIKEKISALDHEVEEHRVAREEIKKLNLVLEDRVQERTEELEATIQHLNQTREQLIISEKMASLGELVAGIAHEINTPIGIAVTAASHLQEKTAQTVNNYRTGQLRKSEFEGYFKNAEQGSGMILTNLRRAAELIKSFKQVAVDQTSEEIRTYNLNGYLGEIILSLRPKLKRTRHKIEINCPPDLQINGYPGIFSQIITNLITNTLTHGFGEKIESGLISMIVSKRDRLIDLNYSDNGIGVSEIVAKKIFDPFFTTTRGQGGSGLGMHIVYNLVTQKLQGSIRCRPLDQGVSFLITFPEDINI